MKRLSIASWFLLFILVSIMYTSCIISAGTHGSLKSYRYAVKKNVLQQAVMNVIKNDTNIYRDTSLDYLRATHNNSEKDKAVGDNYHNDVDNYITIDIKSGEHINGYIFRYYGDEEYWRNSESSEIFIAYVRDRQDKWGSEGNGQVSPEMKKMFIDIFEKIFIANLNKELGMGHEIDHD